MKRTIIINPLTADCFNIQCNNMIIIEFSPRVVTLLEKTAKIGNALRRTGKTLWFG